MARKETKWTDLTNEQKELVFGENGGLRLIHLLMQDFSEYFKGKDYSEYIGPCVECLCKAATTYKPEKGKFTTHARGAIRHAIARKEFQDRGTASAKEIISINELENPLAGKIDKCEHVNLKKIYKIARKKLTPKELRIVKMRYLKSMSCVQIGLKVGMTREGVRRALRRIPNKLKGVLKDVDIESFILTGDED